MRFRTLGAALLVAISSVAGAQRSAKGHMTNEPELKWMPAPAVFPKGAQMAVLQGDPSSASMFTFATIESMGS